MSFPPLESMYNFPVNEFTSADEKLTVIVFCSLKAISVIVGVTEKGDDSPFSTERVAFNVFIPSLESINSCDADSPAFTIPRSIFFVSLINLGCSDINSILILSI